ncbi:MAG: hypothetical protein SF172_18690 [Burkholderiales bacterium]|nr:hypothetical protein [Burkholderiales bacterium]
MTKAARKPTPAVARKKPLATSTRTEARTARVSAKASRPAPNAKATPKAIPKATPKATAKAKAQKAKSVPKKSKTIRDSFNMPESDYALIGQLKKRALAQAREIKKSELLRAGLKLLAALGEEAFKSALAAVPSVKTGRPKK